jgi:molybdopterin converting factor small subunit
MISVKIAAPFSLSSADPSGEVQVPEGTSVLRLLQLGRAPMLAYLMPISVNGQQVPKTYRLQDGDLLVFIAPMSGG